MVLTDFNCPYTTPLQYYFTIIPMNIHRKVKMSQNIGENGFTDSKHDEKGNGDENGATIGNMILLPAFSLPLLQIKGEEPVHRHLGHLWIGTGMIGQDHFFPKSILVGKKTAGDDKMSAAF